MKYIYQYYLVYQRIGKNVAEVLKKLGNEYVQCQGFEHKASVAHWVNEEKKL